VKPAVLQILWDALLLLPRLIAASLKVLFAKATHADRSRLGKLTSSDWLAARLELDPQRIAAATIEEVHTGTASRSRLHIRYTGDPAAPPGPASLFIKSSPPDFGSALFGVLLDLGGNEVEFYRHLRRDVPVQSPRVYASEGDSASYLLLLEDLTDQGCDFRDLTSKCSPEEATSVVTTLAQLHAGFWQSERFATDLSWVRRLETNRDARLLNLVRHLSVPIACRKFGHLLPPGTQEVIPHLLERYPRLEPLWAEEPRTLIHGDAHLGNMYFQDGRAGLLDWQVSQLGQGMRDISYFMINSLDEALRLEHQERLVRHYLGTLRERGVSLDFDTAWRQYRLQSVYAWIAGIVTAPSQFQPESVVLTGLSRACKAILDLDAVALIREL
jgi:hypothetical protein